MPVGRGPKQTRPMPRGAPHQHRSYVASCPAHANIRDGLVNEWQGHGYPGGTREGESGENRIEGSYWRIQDVNHRLARSLNRIRF
jgi:hypothetical protein